MKQTAVEWLVKEINEIRISTESRVFINKLQKQAKEMEKEQIIEAAYFGHIKGFLDNGVENSFGEQYYNETFKSE